MHLHRLLRNRAIGLSRRALAPLSAWRTARAPATVPLASVRRRLELMLAAMYGRPMSIGADSTRAHATDTPHDILLPPWLDARTGFDAARERYRLLAIERAARLVRGTAAELLSDPLERDLFELVEGASIDRDIAERAPGLVSAITALRHEELVTRPALHRVPTAEREVESLLQSLLAAPPRDDVPSVPRTQTPSESRAWARERAAQLRVHLSSGARYIGVRPVGMWRIGPAPRRFELPTAPGQSARFGDVRHASTVSSTSGETQGDERDGGDAPGEPSTEGAHTGADAPRPGEENAPGAQQDAGLPAFSPKEDEAPTAPGGIRYREWDEYGKRYRPEEVTVRARVAAETDDGWALATLRAHAPLVRQIRGRFAPLRAHRTRLRAQRVGDELDLDECVAALVEMRRGRVPSDRLHRVTKAARRTLAIMLLVDVSGSTKAQVADGRTVLDVERMTLLLASEALDELGDPYAVLAFSSSGRHDVQVDTVKAFTDHDPAIVRRRVSALAAARNTRLGAAVRHATALLNAQPAERRLLLLLSDGQPNDVGGYQGSYAMADSRRAVHEARACGVHPFCLTVDREEQEYLPHLFGVNGYRILREPAQLPAALLQVVTQLLPG